MSVQRIILIATVASFALVSCQKEEFTPVTPNTPAVDPGTSISIDDTLSTELQSLNLVRNVEDAEAVLTPCGTSFHADVRISNSVAPGTYYYEITEVGSNEVVDYGMIGHGDHTNPVLRPCTQYVFKFFGGLSTAHPALQILSSDGCGGVFDC